MAAHRPLPEEALRFLRTLSERSGGARQMVQAADVASLEPDRLDVVLGYLRERGWITRLSGNHVLITAEGIATAEESVASEASSGEELAQKFGILWSPRQAEQDFDAWAGRAASIGLLYESDLATKPQVRLAEYALAKELQRRGVTVKAVRLPRRAGRREGRARRLPADTLRRDAVRARVR
jgi:hypothetical protein